MSDTHSSQEKHLELRVYDLLLIVVAVISIVVVIWQLFLVQNPEIAARHKHIEGASRCWT